MKLKTDFISETKTKVKKKKKESQLQNLTLKHVLRVLRYKLSNVNFSEPADTLRRINT